MVTRDKNSQLTDQEKTKIEQVKYLYHHAPAAIPFNVIILTVIVAFLWQYVETVQVIILWVSFCVISLLRYYNVIWINKHDYCITNPQRALGLFVVGSLLMGVAWAIVFLTFADDVNAINQVFIVTSLGGMSAGAVISMATSRAAFLSYLLPLILTPVVWYISHQTSAYLGIALVILLFIVGMLIAHQRTYEAIFENIKLTLEKDSLLDSITDANKKLTQANEFIKAISNTDDLTKIANRRYFMEIMEKEWQRSVSTNSSLTIFLLDVDFFKQYNDNYGHVKGDKCLYEIAQTINNLIKDSSNGLLARYGGEEFIILLSDLDMVAVNSMSEELHAAVAKKNIEHKYSKVQQHVTVSAGIATTLDNNFINIREFIASADTALYQAKEGGRNYSVIYKKES